MITKLRIWLWKIVTGFYPKYLQYIYGMDIGNSCVIAWSAHLDKSINPKGIHIGDGTNVLREAMILSHDACRSLKTDTYIGENCIIGVRSIILPGIHIGNQVVVGGGSIVTKDIPSNCIAAGNPAKIIGTGVKVKNGKIIENGNKVKR